MDITIELNGKNYKIKKNTSINQLINDLKLDLKKIAIELNQTIIQQEEFNDKILKKGDKIEIIHFVGGG